MTAPRQRPADGVRLVEFGHVSHGWSGQLLNAATSIKTPVQRIFEVSLPPLQIDVYGTHVGFARALESLEDESPQGDGDNLGNIVHGILPVGPSLQDLRHRMAHVFSEWVMDRLTHNRTDAQPRPAWLYDGLAEEVAQSIAPISPCRLQGRTLIPLHMLASPRFWWRIRGTPLGGAEYCEGERAARTIVRGVGWNRLVGMLHDSGSFSSFAMRVMSH